LLRCSGRVRETIAKHGNLSNDGNSGKDNRKHRNIDNNGNRNNDCSIVLGYDAVTMGTRIPKFRGDVLYSCPRVYTKYRRKKSGPLLCLQVWGCEHPMPQRYLPEVTPQLHFETQLAIVATIPHKALTSSRQISFIFVPF